MKLFFKEQIADSSNLMDWSAVTGDTKISTHTDMHLSTHWNKAVDCIFISSSSGHTLRWVTIAPLVRALCSGLQACPYTHSLFCLCYFLPCGLRVVSAVDQLQPPLLPLYFHTWHQAHHYHIERHMWKFIIQLLLPGTTLQPTITRRDDIQLSYMMWQTTVSHKHNCKGQIKYKGT